MAGLFVFMPPLFLIVIYLILSIIKAFAQAIIGYLLALLGITFLFTVAPIFVSFALFRVTAGWFEVWLKHLASFTLQLMIVFTFFMLMIMIDLVTFLQNIGLMVRQYQHVFSFGFLHIPVNVYTLCHVKREGGNPNGEIIYYRFDETGQLGEVEAAGKYAGFPACVEEYTIGDIIPSLATGPVPGYNAQRPPSRWKKMPPSKCVIWRMKCVKRRRKSAKPTISPTTRQFPHICEMELSLMKIRFPRL